MEQACNVILVCISLQNNFENGLITLNETNLSFVRNPKRSKQVLEEIVSFHSQIQSRQVQSCSESSHRFLPCSSHNLLNRQGHVFYTNTKHFHNPICSYTWRRSAALLVTQVCLLRWEATIPVVSPNPTILGLSVSRCHRETSKSEPGRRYGRSETWLLLMLMAKHLAVWIWMRWRLSEYISHT